MAYEDSAGLNVSNHYGPRDSGKTVGVYKTEGSVSELKIWIDGTIVGAGAFPLIAPKLPAGAKILGAYLETQEVFVLGGTTPVVDIGTEGSEATNGFTISEAQLETLGTYDVTGAISGTWANPLAAETTVGILLGGTTPTVTAAGKAQVLIRYVEVGA